eukprot:m.782599 g.782599  ORF g.782599 m.782599 type:complete len:266 (-) comp59152_c1_seq24:48-845(-)
MTANRVTSMTNNVSPAILCRRKLGATLSSPIFLTQSIVCSTFHVRGLWPSPATVLRGSTRRCWSRSVAIVCDAVCRRKRDIGAAQRVENARDGLVVWMHVHKNNLVAQIVRLHMSLLITIQDPRHVPTGHTVVLKTRPTNGRKIEDKTCKKDGKQLADLQKRTAVTGACMVSVWRSCSWLSTTYTHRFALPAHTRLFALFTSTCVTHDPNFFFPSSWPLRASTCTEPSMKLLANTRWDCSSASITSWGSSKTTRVVRRSTVNVEY